MDYCHFGIHHKIDKKTNIAQHSPRAARIFLKTKTKMMGSSPPAQLGLPTMLAPFHFLVRFRQKREFKKIIKILILEVFSLQK
jgi:hypothetical protein